ncbi:hypothetical protein J4402_01510 [Candidatus Pacearchaeota archaeon]|nr:hypothetical protein [Candidatus Pacearchaeota archaeon]
MIKKRGLSSIITSVLIVLLVIVAVGVVASFFFPMIDDLKSSIEFNEACRDFDIEVTKAEFNSDPGPGADPILTIIVTRNNGAGALSKINFIIDDKTISVDDDDATDLTEFGSKEFKNNNANPSNVGIDLATQGLAIKAIPVILVYGKEIICENAISEPKKIDVI